MLTRDLFAVDTCLSKIDIDSAMVCRRVLRKLYKTYVYTPATSLRYLTLWLALEGEKEKDFRHKFS